MATYIEVMHTASSDVSHFDCSICLSHFNDPKLLTCFHTFCMQCLEEYVTRSGKDGKFECPLCRTSMDIPVGGVKSFQSNFYIKVEGLSEAEVDCDVCENGQKSRHYCLECEEHFCETCSVAHSKMKMTRQHKIVQLSNSSEGCNRKIQKKTYCLHHNGEEIKMICKDCNALLCVVCKLTEHENHCTSGIAKEATERRVLLSENVKDVESVMKNLKLTIYRVEKCSDEIQKKLEMSVLEIDEFVKQLVKQIRDDSYKMKQELQISCTEVLDYYLKQKKILLEKVCEGEAAINHIRNVVDVGSDLHILDANLQTKLQSSKTTAANISVKNMTHAIFIAGNTSVAPYEFGKIIKTKKNFLKTKENVINDESIGNTHAAHVVSVTTGNMYAGFLDFKRLLKHDTETKVIETERPLLLEDIEQGSVSGLTFDEKGKCFFSHLHSRSICTLGKPPGNKICEINGFPYGIAFKPSCKDSSSIRELLVCALDTIASKTKFECRSSKGCVMAVPLVQQVKTCYKWREDETPGPTCIAVNYTNGLVCLGYPAARKVTLNSAYGDVLSEFAGAMELGSPEKFCPTGVCFDNGNDVIIADYGNNAVIRIDENGMFLQCLITGSKPLCVAFGIENIMLYVGFMDKNITSYKLKIQESL